MEPMLMVIGLNYRSAPVEIRERFWISETGRYDAVLELALAGGIEEVVVLAKGTYQDSATMYYTVTYDRGPKQNPEGSMVKGDVVFVKNKKIRFVISL